MNKPFVGRKTVFFSLIILILLLIGAYYYFNPKKAMLMVFPNLEGITGIYANIGSDSAHTTVDLVLKNQSPFKLVIDTVYLKVELNNIMLAEQTVAVRLDQEKHQTDTVKFPLNISVKKIRKTIEDLSAVDSTDLKITSYAVYNTFLGKVKMPVERIIRIAVPVPPKIKVLKVERGKFHLRDKQLDATISIEIINKGKNVDIKLTDIHYKLVVKDNFETDGMLQQSIRIKPGSTQVIDIPVVIKIDRPLKTLMNIATDNDTYPYSLYMNCMLKEMQIKAEERLIPVEITNQGKMEIKKEKKDKKSK